MQYASQPSINSSQENVIQTRNDNRPLDKSGLLKTNFLISKTKHVLLVPKRIIYIVLLMYCYYKFYVALPHDTMGWSAVCDCGIS